MTRGSDRSPLPDDTALTVDEVDLASGTEKLLIVACGALARELIAVLDANGFDHVAVKCLPAILHNHPERIVPAVEDAVEAARSDYDRVFVAYADCGTGGELARAAERLGVEMLPGAHCYAFFEGVDAFAARAEDEMTAFFVTDFLARQFDAFVWKPLGLDRHPELRDVYFGHYDRLIYQAQTDDPALTARAQEAAERLGLAFERRRTGFGDLGREVERFGKSARD